MGSWAEFFFLKIKHSTAPLWICVWTFSAQWSHLGFASHSFQMSVLVFTRKIKYRILVFSLFCIKPMLCNMFCFVICIYRRYTMEFLDGIILNRELWSNYFESCDYLGDNEILAYQIQFYLILWNPLWYIVFNNITAMSLECHNDSNH